jgi:hypothetical protein
MISYEKESEFNFLVRGGIFREQIEEDTLKFKIFQTQDALTPYFALDHFSTRFSMNIKALAKCNKEVLDMFEKDIYSMINNDELPTTHMAFLIRNLFPILIVQKRYDELVNKLKELISNGYVVDNTYRLGVVELERDNLKQAEQHFKDVLDLLSMSNLSEFNHINAVVFGDNSFISFGSILGLAHIAFKRKKFKDAYDLVATSLKFCVTDPEAYMLMSNICIKLAEIANSPKKYKYEAESALFYAAKFSMIDEEGMIILSKELLQ